MPLDENQNPNHKNNRSALAELGVFVWDLAKILIVALAIIIPFRMFIAEPFVVSGSSMLPNFHNRDYLIIDRLSYRLSQPQRGDVIVLKFPRDNSQFFIKRIVGLPGETVAIQQGHVVVYNAEHPERETLKEPYLSSQTETIGRGGQTVLGSGEYFVLGDNRTASSDSRAWGILPREDIVGKVWARVFPVSRAGFFEHPEYN